MLKNSYSIQAVILASLLILVVFLLVYLTKNRESLKKYFFLGIAITTLLTTIFLVSSTLYLNSVSVTKGPVHWHAGFEVFYCGKKVDLKNPVGLSNKIGTPILHEHNDNRIHVEGVVITEKDVSFGNFVKVIGGAVTEDSLTVPTVNGNLMMRDGDECSDGTLGEINAFLYKVEGKNIGRERFSDMNHLRDHVLSPYTSVPPGDCIIIVFAAYISRSDKLCESYKAAISKGDLTNGN